MEQYKIENLLNDNLIFMDVEAEDSESLLCSLAEEARVRGYVKEGYAEAVLERERLYPTALPTEIMKVAVPHSMERDQVIKPVIIIATLKKPVNFKEMGDGENDIPVDIVFMLAVCGSKDQLVILQKIIGLFSNRAALQDIKNAKDAKELKTILLAHMDD